MGNPVLDFLRSECRYMSVEELRHNYPEDSRVDEVLGHPLVESARLLPEQLEALARYTPTVMTVFPDMEPMTVPNTSVQFCPSVTTEYTRKEGLIMVRSQRLDYLPDSVRVPCVRFNYRIDHADEVKSQASVAVPKRDKLKDKPTRVCVDALKLLSRRRAPFTVADIFWHLGVDLRSNPTLASELRLLAHYDGRDQSFTMTPLEWLFLRGKASWQELKREFEVRQGVIITVKAVGRLHWARGPPTYEYQVEMKGQVVLERLSMCCSAVR